MNKKMLGVAVVVTTLMLMMVGSAFATSGFDEFGYNYKAMVFVGKADGVDRVLDGKVWGDPTYANDHFVMKWSKAWNDSRFHGAEWTSDAWETNEWNGMFEGGSGSVWHYKIVWFDNSVTKYPDYYELPDGGYVLWGQFEVLMDQGIDPSIGPGHLWFALAIPNGFGGP